MSQFLDKLKSWLPHLSWVLAGLIVAINPQHIDKFAEAHPQWTGLIMAAWAALMAWANKIRPKPPTQPDMSQAGQNPTNSSQKQVYIQGRRP